MLLSHLEMLVAAMRAQANAEGNADPRVCFDTYERGSPKYTVSLIGRNIDNVARSFRVYDEVDDGVVKGGDFALSITPLVRRE